jgi:class 3 adenylate cyclase
MSDPIAVSRRLVAVFAADVEGYSRLMSADEVGTLVAYAGSTITFVLTGVRE